MMRKLLSMLIILSTLVAFGSFSPIQEAYASEVAYYVAVNGNDNNDGLSLSTPFRTVQKAANTAQAGDTVFIRAGIYRETITPAHNGTYSNPITFTAYNDEDVTISGLDPVTTSWVQYNGNVYYTNITMSMGDRNAVFVNDNLMEYARWPNKTSADIFDKDCAFADLGTGYYDLYDADLPNPAGGLSGGVVWTLSRCKWDAIGMTIDSSESGVVHFTPNAWDLYMAPEVGCQYYISGKLGLLDAEKEWYYDAGTNRLYLYKPNGGNPSDNTVEVKARDLAFDLTGKSGISITNINVKGARFVITGDYNTIDSVTATYTFTHNGRNMNHSFYPDGVNFYEEDTYNSISGTLIGGSYNTVKNSEFAYSAGMLFAVLGRNCRIDNNYLHDADYMGAWDGMIRLGTEKPDCVAGGSIITRNTMARCGRSCIDGGGWTTTKMVIKYNDLSDAMMLSEDGGFLYLPDGDFRNTEIAFNTIHDLNTARLTNMPTSGLYFDDGSHNFHAHHNVIYNITSGKEPLHCSNIGMTKKITNITSYNCVTDFIRDSTGSIVDNIFHNQPSSNFVDAVNHDFRLSGSSNAIDQGNIYAPSTDGYSGSAPDLGAYEYNAGARLSSWTSGVGSILYDEDKFPILDSNYNLWTNSGASASSSIANFGWHVRCGIDGNKNTLYYSGGHHSQSTTSNHTEWYTINATKAYKVSRVDIYPRNDTGHVGDGFPIDFSIKVSTDNVNWTTVISRTSYPLPGNEVQSFSFPEVDARYVKLEATNLRPYDSNNYALVFAEMEVYTAPYAAINSKKGNVMLWKTGELYQDSNVSYSVCSVPDGWFGNDEGAWELVSIGGGYYNIHNKMNDLYLWNTGEFYNGSNVCYNVCAAPWNNLDEARWQLEETGGGYYKIINKKTGNILWKTGEQYNGSNECYNVCTAPNGWDSLEEAFWKINWN